LSFADYSPLSHIPILLVCHASRRTPCSLRFDTSLPSLWDNPPFLAWSWGVTRRDVASRLVRDAPFHTRSTPLPFSIYFSGSTFFLFPFFADRSPSLTGAQGPLSLTNAIGVPSFLIRTAPLGVPPLFSNLRALRLSAHEHEARRRSQLVRLFSFSSFFHSLTDSSLLPASPQCVPSRAPSTRPHLRAHSMRCPLRTPLSRPFDTSSLSRRPCHISRRLVVSLCHVVCLLCLFVTRHLFVVALNECRWVRMRVDVSLQV
jgi:hypothetical protein